MKVDDIRKSSHHARFVCIGRGGVPPQVNGFDVKKSCDGNSTTDSDARAMYSRPYWCSSPHTKSKMENSAFQNHGAETAPGSTPNWVEGHVLNPFVNAVAIHPFNAAANVVNFAARPLYDELLDKQEDLPIAETTMLSPGWFVQNVSSGLGMVLPYMIAGKAAGRAMESTAAKLEMAGSTAAVMKSEIAAQMTGAALYDFSRDTMPGETRLGNAVGGALGFYVFGKGNALTLTDSFAKRQIARAAVGSVGGMAQLTGSRLVSGEGLPALDDTLAAGISGGALNVAMSPTQHAISRGFEASGKVIEQGFRSKQLSPIRDAYYRASWKYQDAKVEVKKGTYSLLNKMDMRHPLQRLGNFLHQTDFSDRAIRPKLTADNNPAAAFETELPEFYKQIKQQEQLLEGKAPRSEEAYAIDDKMKEIRTDFAFKLLQIWHGTPEAPGMKSYSDSELATSTISAQRVAQIRKTLMEPVRVHNDDVMAGKLLQLVPEEVRPDGRERNHSLTGELETAKEKFFGYDNGKIIGMMSMPGFQHAAVRHFETGIDWMPHHATEQFPNLFHGTMSDVLPSVFAEKVMLPAKELRLRGIEQTSGESAGDNFPHRSISITRDFGEAFNYHMHSPLAVTGYPVVFGISADVIPRSYPAGMSEPGEILTGKLRLGSSVLTTLGIQGKAITHVYVPDGQVADVTRQLSNHRVKGLTVLGFGQLTEPIWNTAHKYYKNYVENYGEDKPRQNK